jgi:ribonuclease E
MKDVEVSPTGMVRLVGEAAPGPALVAAPGAVEPAAPAGEAEAEAAPPVDAEAEAERAEAPKRGGRRRSRGGRRRRRGGSDGNGETNASPASAETAAGTDDAEQQSA